MLAPHVLTKAAETWLLIFSVAALAISGEVLTAGAMRRIGDLDDIRAVSGLPGAIRAVLSSPMFVIGALCMAVNFFALLFTLSVVDVSLAAPATASLTYIGNAICAKLFLHENVDGRRWLAAGFVVVGVVLLAH
jgi:drug/metabolite transporter (DMT)-like permease